MGPIAYASPNLAPEVSFITPVEYSWKSTTDSPFETLFAPVPFVHEVLSV